MSGRQAWAARSRGVSIARSTSQLLRADSPRLPATRSGREIAAGCDGPEPLRRRCAWSDHPTVPERGWLRIPERCLGSPLPVRDRPGSPARAVATMPHHTEAGIRRLAAAELVRILHISWARLKGAGWKPALGLFDLRHQPAHTSLAGQAASHLGPRPVQPGLHGSDRPADRFADLSVRQLLFVVHHNDHAVLGPQGR